KVSKLKGSYKEQWSLSKYFDDFDNGDHHHRLDPVWKPLFGRAITDQAEAAASAVIEWHMQMQHSRYTFSHTEQDKLFLVPLKNRHVAIETYRLSGEVSTKEVSLYSQQIFSVGPGLGTLIFFIDHAELHSVPTALFLHSCNGSIVI
ncbi:hypothetical protein TYRP_017473, partial [Tyrophagus putrescentiae]